VSVKRIERALHELEIDPVRATCIAPALHVFVGELSAGNKRFGLIGKDDASDQERILTRHVLDSLTPWRVLQELLRESGRDRLYDLGSGAGLPGVPLALALAHSLKEAVLVDRRSKRLGFLMGAVPVVTAAVGRIESADRATGPAGTSQADEAAGPAGLDSSVGVGRAEGGSRSSGCEGPPRIRIVESDAYRLRSREAANLSRAAVVYRAFEQTSTELASALADELGPEAPILALKGRLDRSKQEADILRASGRSRDVRVTSFRPPDGGGPERTAISWYTK
jgi:hypothetical protein